MERTVPFISRKGLNFLKHGRTDFSSTLKGLYLIWTLKGLNFPQYGKNRYCTFLNTERTVKRTTAFPIPRTEEISGHSYRKYTSAMPKTVKFFPIIFRQFFDFSTVFISSSKNKNLEVRILHPHKTFSSRIVASTLYDNASKKQNHVCKS